MTVYILGDKLAITLRALTFLALSITCVLSTGQSTRPSLPPNGVVPDEATAVKVAEALFAPIFGADEIAKYLPYHAQLKDGVWTVYGTLKSGSRGGTPEVDIQKMDCKVIRVWHSM